MTAMARLEGGRETEDHGVDLVATGGGTAGVPEKRLQLEWMSCLGKGVIIRQRRCHQMQKKNRRRRQQGRVLV